MDKDAVANRGSANKPLRMQEQRWWGVLLLVAYFVLIMLLPLLAHLYRFAFPGISMGLTRTLGLVGFSILALQVAMGARLKFIDRPWGLDKVLLFHRRMAMAAFGILLLHPLAAFFSYVQLSGIGTSTAFQMVLSYRGGIAALILMIAIVLFARSFKKFGVSYQIWRNTHKAAIIVVVIGFFHGLNAAGEAMPPPMRIYFIALFVGSVLLFLYGNIGKKWWGRSHWRVDSVTQETHDTFTLIMKPEKQIDFSYHPGQFIFLGLKRPGRPSEEHPFTISSCPGHDTDLSVTIKESGDFTNTISQTIPGDRARMDGPFGRFSYVFDSPENIIFIAGGAGITPILSMMRFLRDSNDRRNVTLIYANKTERDIIRREELDAMPENMDVHYVLDSPPEGWDGHTGPINKDMIKACTDEHLLRSDVYLCGPPAMMKAVRRQLKDLGVPRTRVHHERFAF